MHSDGVGRVAECGVWSGECVCFISPSLLFLLGGQFHIPSSPVLVVFVCRCVCVDVFCVCVCVCAELSPLWCVVCGVGRHLESNAITTISSGTFDGLISLTLLCAQRWCGENGAVWCME